MIYIEKTFSCGKSLYLLVVKKNEIVLRNYQSDK